MSDRDVKEGYNKLEDELIYPEEGEQEAVEEWRDEDEDDCD